MQYFYGIIYGRYWVCPFYKKTSGEFQIAIIFLEWFIFTETGKKFAAFVQNNFQNTPGKWVEIFCILNIYFFSFDSSSIVSHH